MNDEKIKAIIEDIASRATTAIKGGYITEIEAVEWYLKETCAFVCKGKGDITYNYVLKESWRRLKEMFPHHKKLEDVFDGRGKHGK